MKKPELLCPAGALANLKAAVASGADAVYLGMQNFTARAYAKNFNEEYLKKAAEICKANNVKIYLTMNTLVKNSEIKDFFKQLDFAYLMGIDAVIIQEPSFLRIIKENYPGLKVHMSTQTGVLNSIHANLFKEADRVNIARELSKEQIRVIRKNFAKEIEIFVHGALCVCISGSCLFSSFIGGRSGNRGRCAQPCRKLYDVRNAPSISEHPKIPEKTQEFFDGIYYLSTKELSLIDKINEIKKLGINSLKIEGRMRTPYYVATTALIYRKALDNENFKLTPEILKKLRSAYSREFTCGKYAGEEVFNRQKAEGKSEIREETYNVLSKPFFANRKVSELKLPAIKPSRADKKQLLVRVYSKKDALLADKNGADIVYIDMFDKDFLDIKKSVKKVYAVTPRIMFDSDLEEIRKRIKEIKPDGILAGSLGILGMNLGIPVHLDYNCNCFNDYTLAYYEILGAFPIISPELSIEEQAGLKDKRFASFVHGKIRLMTLAHQMDRKEITDEKKFKFKINRIRNGSEILNEKELGLFNKARNLLKSGINSFFIDTEENAGEITRIYRDILDGKTPDVSGIRKNYVLGWSKEGVL
ncbi:hypothetical protein A3K73_04225 [Candidatus Pacearchaeota archaeon RBG_13_36_9]|nr:MAG: hypothetical protein A3K73_04225 [Candidatus Pacearchaeota archaeon RBG_13_36_9]